MIYSFFLVLNMFLVTLFGARTTSSHAQEVRKIKQVSPTILAINHGDLQNGILSVSATVPTKLCFPDFSHFNLEQKSQQLLELRVFFKGPDPCSDVAKSVGDVFPKKIDLNLGKFKPGKYKLKLMESDQRHYKILDFEVPNVNMKFSAFQEPPLDEHDLFIDKEGIMRAD